MKFIRYPGGKQRLLSFLINYLPEKNSIRNRYIEPFIGGGSIFFYFNPEDAIISDINNELIELYKGVRNYPHKVWEIFNSFPIGKQAYYHIRDDEYKRKPIYFRAARTLFLNRTCFKGMWRHNPNGKFNVGYGGEDRRWVVTHKNLIELSKVLKKSKILNEDFENVLQNVEDNDFIFFDPPYKPGEKDLKECHYLNGGFVFQEQERLANSIKKISNQKNVKWLMTNSSNESILSLYKDFDIVKIPKGTGKSIGALTNNSQEVLIKNY